MEVEQEPITESGIPRGAPEDTPEARLRHVQDLIKMVKADAKHWSYAFRRIEEWRRFARGIQWPGTRNEDLSDADRRYVANITMRHLLQRRDAIYAKNPTYKWRHSRKMLRKHWDGTATQLNMAQQLVQSGLDQTGSALAILQDAISSKQQADVTQKIGETATILYQYFLREQNPPLKKMMKKQILTSLTSGAAYFKQTFQRASDYTPEVQRSIEDARSQLAKIERLSADITDGEITSEDAEAEELRAMLQALEESETVILREGIAIDYPDTTNIIPDRNMTYLPGFVGCDHVTEQYCLTPEQIQEIYGKDIKGNYTQYKNSSKDEIGKAQTTKEDGEEITGRVWEIWDKVAGLVYTVCDGYDDYLDEPHAPITYTERFYPWFVYAPNAVDDPDDPYPPSDVELIMPMQMEINRAGEGLRQHRWAARPGWVTGANVPDEDKLAMERRAPHTVVSLKSLGPDERIDAKFQPFPTSPIDPNLYSTGPAFSDILRSVGTQEANLGGTSGATATETSISQSSRQSTTDSAIDEFDDLLTEMARAGGQILFEEMSPEKVLEIVGPGAMWPDLSRHEVAAEIHLEVESGSSGRKNRAQEVQVRERMYPLMFQIPGYSQEFMLRDMLNVLDDSIRPEDAIDMNALSIMAMNGQQQAASNKGDGQGDNGQGGSDNAQRPPAPSSTGPAKPGQDAPPAPPMV